MHLLFRFSAAALLAAAAGAAAHAQTTDTLPSSALQWREIVPGAHFAAAHGDWDKEAHGKFVRISKQAEIPLHVHTNDYHAVFVSGRMANILDKDTRVEVGPGDYFYMAAKRPHAHQCLTDEPCLFYTYGQGHWDLEVVEGQ